MNPSSEDATPNKRFACPACPSRFTRPENLNRHTSSVHRESNRRPFTCPQCDVSFSRSDLRKRHLRKCHAQSTAAVQETASATLPTSSQLVQTDQVSAEPWRNEPAPQQTSTASPMSTSPHSTSVSRLLSTQGISWAFRLPQCISAFFDKFQPVFPLLHKPTFDVTTAREPLLQAVACIGAIYVSGVGCNRSMSSALFESGLASLEAYVRENRATRFRETWVLQAFLLLEYYALHSCADRLFTTALKIHRNLVDVTRQHQLLQDGTSFFCGETGLTTHPERPSSATPPERAWENAVQSESRKRIAYCLYYLDVQFSLSCNIRPLLAALELKYELPIRDDIWQAPTAEAWQALVLTQGVSFNEQDDDIANCDPRPAHGDLYQVLMHLINPDPPSGPLQLMWQSPFSCLMLIIQMLMMTRDLTLAGTFLFHNIRGSDSRHNLSIIPEGNRTSIMQALNALADLMCKPEDLGWPNASVEADQTSLRNTELWNHVWIMWHFTAMALTHQDSLLTSGIVEYSLPSAIYTLWELGKPRSKPNRDVYEDRDVIRVANNLESILSLLSRTSQPISVLPPSNDCASQLEDPFITMVSFKACLMGWRIVRLMSLQLDPKSILDTATPSLYIVSAQVILARVLTAMNPESPLHPDVNRTHAEIFINAESRYLEQTEALFTRKNLWPLGISIVAVFGETREELGFSIA
ncbi:fungal-specific transcription factor domain-containing protein [Nemania sp. FL0031]|nr:fungal-specific transcription factor domain-containing protein [Nemania sp. FL0031]